ncbi:hypothetical protein AHF37_01008 [Paragonimus kellicotti]|nr:hypothetical protein AHF37_01008 [Paragonimus kellicotti]
MAELDQRIGLLEDTEEKPSELSIPVGASCATLRTMLRDMEKKQRILNSKLQFLVTEVRDLATVRQMLTDHGTKQARYTKKLTAEVLRWKQDYVKLLESCIAAFQIDPSQGLMFSDYGRNKCKTRLAELLEDARRKDPTLPSLNKQVYGKTPISEKYHVDIYGFKQSYTNEAALMHYACRHLYEFFIRQRAGDDNLTNQWTEIMKNPTRELFREELKNLCRAGVPANLRSGVWRMLIHGELKQTILDKGPHYYDRLISEISESKIATKYRKQIALDLLRTMPNNIQFDALEAPGIATKYRKQIALDLLRTMPNNIQFDALEAPGIQKLQEILQAYSIHNPEVGYCQGMNFLVAVALIFLSKEDAFWCLTAILERYLPEKYFNYGLISAQVDQLVLKDLLSSKLPKLFAHIQKMEIDISAITLNWFLAIFYDSVPFEVSLFMIICRCT